MGSSGITQVLFFFFLTVWAFNRHGDRTRGTMAKAVVNAESVEPDKDLFENMAYLFVVDAFVNTLKKLGSASTNKFIVKPSHFQVLTSFYQPVCLWVSNIQVDCFAFSVELIFCFRDFFFYLILIVNSIKNTSVKKKKKKKKKNPPKKKKKKKKKKS